MFGSRHYCRRSRTLLFAIRAGFYVVLGRPTLREPAGSEFVDLDQFEQELFERGERTDGETFQKTMTELRARYGTRVPAQVLRTFIDNELSDTRQEKKRLLADADRKGTTINIDSLRTDVLANRPTGLDEDRYLLTFERSLLGLEVKYGPEIPVSAVDDLLDALSGEEPAST